MSLSGLTQAWQVLIVSSHPILAQTLARLAREANCRVIASVADLRQALEILRPASRVTVIVTFENLLPREDEWLALLRNTRTARRVILLSLNQNEMIVHEQRRVTRVGENELKQVLSNDSTALSFRTERTSSHRKNQVSRRDPATPRQKPSRRSGKACSAK